LKAGNLGNQSDYEVNDRDDLGKYETIKLINAISKITTLLRKCWGVAGAGIISANLARNQDGDTVVFNPTVPGRLVYAIFGFAGINDFSDLLRSLDNDVMKLINDVANVVHNENFRWGHGNSGQCNKNLGATFLMVYKIGDFKEVQEKKEQAINVIFSNVNKTIDENPRRRSRRKLTRNRRRSSANSTSHDILNLTSLPGISEFTDRAVLGMLKSFAGINRDKKLMEWKDDFRLGAGVGAFSVEMMFGMDAGWAVEGAVGSEYKIDATYLSPYVNMASRMMSACKQYGLTILMSQSVEELLSEPAREKLRHIDTVFVKGSTAKQRIFTYDSRYKGLNFFLYEKSPELEDFDSSNYTPDIWNTDQDLLNMRKHINPEFEELYATGRDMYLIGSNWPRAIEILKEANRIMLENVVEEGMYESEDSSWVEQMLDSSIQNSQILRLRQSLGDGPCQSLISFMEKEGGVAPVNWKRVRHLTSK